MKLFNFNKKENKEVATLLPKTNAQLIQEVHTLFEEAEEKSFSESTQILSTLPEIDKSKLERLQAIGATSTKQSKEIEELIAKEMANKKLIEQITFYRNKYPMYKYITKQTVSEICKKYGLVCGDLSLFKGDIPKKNLLEIENFKIQDEDKAYSYFHRGEFLRYIPYENFLEQENRDPFYISSFNSHISPTPYQICAPKEDMIIKDRWRVDDGGFIIKDDPIVLQMLPNEDYLLMSKWGLEASDERLINSVEN